MGATLSGNIRDGQYAELSNGTRLHYASAGAPGKPLILFLHGFPEFWYAWHEQLAEFGRDYFAVAPDLRGFNLSSMPQDASAYKARHIMEDLRLFTGLLGYDKFDLVAHDWGGAIAWKFATTSPGLLKHLVIINSPHHYLFMRALANDTPQRQSSGYMNWLRAEGSEAALAKDGFALMDGFFNGMGQPQATATACSRHPPQGHGPQSVSGQRSWADAPHDLSDRPSGQSKQTDEKGSLMNFFAKNKETSG